MNRVENSRVIARVAVLIVLAFAGTATWNRAKAAGGRSDLPDPVVDSPLAAKKGKQNAVVAGGCFWGVQAVFQHVKGVKNATSGYSGVRSLRPHMNRWARERPGTPSP